MLTIKGKKVFTGVAIGPLAIFAPHSTEIETYEIKDVEAEIKRFQQARETAKEQLGGLYNTALEKVGEGEAAIFEIHQMMLDDLDYVESVETTIRNEMINAEAAVFKTGETFSAMFAAMSDDYMKERAADVKDISRRVSNILMGATGIDFSSLGEVIVAADDLAPSETVQLDSKKVLGFVTAQGSTSSHTAILARTLGIAAVVKTRVTLNSDYQGKTAIIDGETGTVYVEPDDETMALMLEKKKAYEARLRELEAVRGKESVTQDGQHIEIFANIGNPDNLPQVFKHDAEGVGLFRSEFLYLGRSTYPTEEEQFAAYKEVAESLGGRKVVIRTLDIGADKQADYFGLDAEENPALGMRAIRICLTRPALFKVQLRAIVRASAYGKIAIMFPMIISPKEVLQAKAILDEVYKELDSKGIPYDKNIEVGIMIETPAAAVMSDALAKVVDFFSVGTNDLTQYTLAIDRQNQTLDTFFDAHHPAVLRLIEMAAQNAHKEGIWIGICGELGADLALTGTFLRMGIDELSVSAPAVLPLREKVRSLKLK